MTSENSINIVVTPESDGTPEVKVNGVVVQEAVGKTVAEVAIETASSNGWNNFRVSVNGVQYHGPTDARGVTVHPGDEVTVRPHDKAGSN